MIPNNKRTSDPAKKSGIAHILAYLGITWVTNIVITGLYSRFFSSFVVSLLSVLPITWYNMWLVSKYFGVAIFCIVSGLLYRRFLFYSKKSPLPAIILLFLLNIAGDLVQYAANYLLNAPGMLKDIADILRTFISLVISLAIVGLGYYLQRFRLYAEPQEAARNATQSASDSDPHFVGIDLDDIEKRENPLRSFSRRLFNRADSDSTTERVIAKSSREAIRVMEHKDLGIKHEWNCDDKDGPRQPDSHNGKPVIAPGSNNTIHVTEHSALGIKHEWNCDDKDGPRQPDSHNGKPVIAPGSNNTIHVTEHSALDMKHEWNCDDQKSR